jgi:hypothetical protein
MQIHSVQDHEQTCYHIGKYLLLQMYLSVYNLSITIIDQGKFPYQLNPIPTEQRVR